MIQAAFKYRQQRWGLPDCSGSHYIGWLDKGHLRVQQQVHNSLLIRR